MNQDLIQLFVENAKAAGLSEKQAEEYVKLQFLGGKSAEEVTADFAGNILDASRLQKTAAASAYVSSFVEAAVERGLGAPEISKLASDLLTTVAPNYPAVFVPVEKTAEEKQAEAAAAEYVTGWFKSAAEHNVPVASAAKLLVKSAEGAVAAGGDQAGLGQAILQFLQQHQNPIAGGLAGAGLGGLAGAVTGDDSEEAAFGGAIPGALIGGGLGALGGQGVDMLKDLKSMPS